MFISTLADAFIAYPIIGYDYRTRLDIAGDDTVKSCASSVTSNPGEDFPLAGQPDDARPAKTVDPRHAHMTEQNFVDFDLYPGPANPARTIIS
jgi:hypothetical protein